MSNTTSFTKDNYDSTKRLIIYGAGRYGELAYYGLKQLGLYPDYFADEYSKESKYLGVPIIAPQNVKKDDIVLIASLNNFNEMLRLMYSQEVEKVYDIRDLLLLEYDESSLSENALAEKKQPEKYIAVVENSVLDEIVIEHLELVLTERCTLRCKKCANLMQYYKHPEDISEDDIFGPFDILLDCVDSIVELRLLGGEPFLSRSLSGVLNRYITNKKIKRITVFTNSTLIPDDDVLSKLTHDNVFVHMSDYGAVSKKSDELEKIFTERGIRFYRQKYDSWVDMGEVTYHEYSEKELTSLYKRCVSANCKSFYRGKLYACPRSAHGERLGFFENPLCDVVDFTNPCDVEKLKIEVSRFLRKKSVYACNYCLGLTNTSKEIKAAEQ